MMLVRRCLVAGVVLLTIGCNPFARRRAPTVPTAQIPPAPRPAQAEEPAEELPEPPDILPGPATPLPTAESSPPPATAEIAPPPVVEPPSSPAPSEEPKPPAEPQPTPQLTQMMTQAEADRYNREIEQNLEAVAGLVRTVSRRRLDEQSALALERVRALAAQAAETRDRDLRTAQGLAARALVLARDLESRTR